MKKTLVRKYAKLIAKVGANVKKGQPVLIYISADQHDFAAMLAEECYRLGASYVRIEWSYLPVSKLAYRWQSLARLSEVPVWQEEKYKLMAEEFPCRIHIVSDDPDGLRGVNVDKMQKASRAVSKVFKPYRDAIESKHQWTIAALPSEAWAKKVFPELKKQQAVEALWKAILDAVFVRDDPDCDPVLEWYRHNEDLRQRCEWLNKKKFEYLTYKSSNGTDFRCDLIPEGIWCGGGETTQKGIYFNPNMPTEEIFTSPKAGACEGTLVSTKPLSYRGNLINGFSIRFEKGRAVEWHAEEGEELLGNIIKTDEGSSMLGELALIPCSSPISRSGILYYETLFDENASCHVALGTGFPDCVEGHGERTLEECRALGINNSLVHVDFMIGAPDMEITGWKKGRATPVFRNGEWAF